MADKERLEEIKEHVKKIESILYDEWRQQELTNLIESLYYADHVDWLINRVEELETQLSINTNNMKHLQNKIERYKQALEEISNADWNSEGLDAERELDKVTDVAIKALEGEE